MLCEVCNKNDAVVHITKVINGKATSLNLCAKCAKESKNIELNPTISLNDFLKGIINISENDMTTFNKKTKIKFKDVQCKSCGMTYEELVENGTVGCKNCYEVFEKDIIDILRRMYGSISYEGKNPKDIDKKSISRENVRILKLRLREAVESENYDEAATLRDLIKKVENEKKTK